MRMTKKDYEVLYSLFKKHLPPEVVADKNLKGGYGYYKEPLDQYYEQAFDHQLEYFDVHIMEDDTPRFEYTWGSANSPMGIFYKHDAEFHVVEKEYADYLIEKKHRMLSEIQEAIVELQKQSVPAERLFVPEHFTHLVSDNIVFGCTCDEHDKSSIIVMSHPIYGRFVEIPTQIE